MEVYNIEGLACAACANSAQKVLGRTDGVEDVRVNYATKTAAIATEAVSLETLNKRLERLGFKLYPKDKNSNTERKIREKKAFNLLKKQLQIGAVFAIPLFVIAMFLPDISYANFIMFGLTLPILLWSGKRFFISAVQQLTVGKVNMDTLVALGTGTAFLFSSFNTFFADFLISRGLGAHVYFEAVGVLLVFILLGKYLEAKAGQQTSDAIEELLAMQVDSVKVIENGLEKELPIEVIAVGDVIKVRPGDSIPLDGKILKGQALLDESMLTGEAREVSKKTGEEVFGGTILKQGSIELLVTQVGEDTVLAQIIRLVEEAQNSQVPIQKLVDKIAGIFVPIVLLISIATFLFWYINGMPAEAFVTAVAVLVVACPCALGLATPTAIMIGIGAAAKKGILIRNAEAIEQTARITSVVLDKTGTITEGQPKITDVYWQSSVKDSSILMNVLVAIENESEHPIAQAFVRDFNKGKKHALLPVETFKNHSGMGVSAKVNGDEYWIGNEGLLSSENISSRPDIIAKASEFKAAAKTVIFFANNKTVLGVLALSDAIKEDSAPAIAALNSKGLEVFMLTGDNKETAKQVALEVGIDYYQAGVLPKDKIAFVQKLQAEGKSIMMVGDGINDAPALAQAEVGVAMNSGTSVAMSSADVVLRNDDLSSLQVLLETSKKMMQIIRQNLFWAFVYNIILIPIAAGVLYPWGILLNPMFAGGAMALSSLFVILNSLRLAK